jgi:hypothetical protein
VVTAVDVDPVEDAAHPTGTHAAPGQAGQRRAGDTSSGEEDIVDGKNPTQRKIEAERRQGPDLPVTPRTKQKAN